MTCRPNSTADADPGLPGCRLAECLARLGIEAVYKDSVPWR